MKAGVGRRSIASARHPSSIRTGSGTASATATSTSTIRCSNLDGLPVIETEAELETKLKIKLANVLKIKNKFTDKLHLPDTQLL